MSEFIVRCITSDCKVASGIVEKTVELFDMGSTIPFIARYRKERTGGLDEVQIQQISERLTYYRELQDRKGTVLKTIEEQGKLSDELRTSITNCSDKQELEDIYLPFKPKRKTRASIAKERGLQPLADLLIAQRADIKNKNEVLSRFVDPQKGIDTIDQALAGALDIISQDIADNASYRAWIRNSLSNRGTLVSKAKKEWAEKSSKFEMYYNFSELLKRSSAHRILAIRRGEAEGVIKWSIHADNDQLLAYLDSQVIRNKTFIFYKELLTAIEDSYKRLLFPALESEVFNAKCVEAERESISVFSKNLKNVLLAPPAGDKVIIAIDPGFRTGCKVAVIDGTGKFLTNTTIYPHEPQNKKNEAEKLLAQLVDQYKVEIIAIGNGTASRETDQIVRELIKNKQLDLISVVVSESGASVYSASEIARKEFPDLDLTVRGAISIARRLQDPLSELVKIDPKSIGVGQYQHDVNQADLKNALVFITEFCVNHVGADLNTASQSLLTYVAGIGPAVAANIVEYRNLNGAFKGRKELLKVAKLGPKMFEQCAGFLKIRNSKNPLDNSAIHPESYHIVERMAEKLECKVKDLIGNDKLLGSLQLSDFVTEEVGIPTLSDIVNELKKPGLDPRAEFSYAIFSDAINDLSDLKPEMVLEGIVTNVANFGAFVDIGVHQDGLVHISKLSDSFVRDPHEVVAVGDNVTVKVLAVDTKLKRINLQLVS
ncbi:MAG TPA: RNA-binding transcriptional accessory protein [Candidatus Margulisbacteria bacterium]|nr:MAG: RNA-binding transcriptional accessory protein [Candidatus Margulisbacteria bacterium GWD2_39_127]HAR63248.1 RNA-binding transcriptional accessory protein [Candidatus Margulisiibacteriota bacterium]